MGMRRASLLIGKTIVNEAGQICAEREGRSVKGRVKRRMSTDKTQSKKPRIEKCGGWRYGARLHLRLRMDWERMMRRAWVAFVALGVAFSGFAAGAGGGAEEFPLAEGAYWIYRGVVRLAGEGDNVTETNVSWRMEVTKVIQREGLTAAVVRGFPGELNWSDGEKKPGESLVIVSDEGKFYHIGEDAGENAAAAGLRRLENPHDKLQDLLQGDDLFLDLPLREGKKFCDEEGMARDDGMYCWVVIAEGPATLANVRGVGAEKRTAFTVRYATNPDDTEFDFVPGVGITAYGYHHHGTVADTDLQLVEFHAGETPR